MTPIRVLLADDHALFRQGVASLLAAEDGFAVVGEAVDGRQALEMARELMPDVILMDVAMPVMDGLEATRRIMAQLPGAKIIIVTVSDGESTFLEAVRSGAQGYLPQRSEPQLLFDTLRAVARGEALVSRAMAARLLQEFDRRGAQPAAAAASVAEPPRKGHRS